MVLAPKRSIYCGSQWFTGSMSTCMSPFFPPHISHLPPVVRQAALTGNTFLCNLPWQGENISIKRRLQRQTSSAPDKPSDEAVFLSAQLCPHFISLPAFYTISDSSTFTSSLLDQYFYYPQTYVCLNLLVLSHPLCPLHLALSMKGLSRDNFSKVLHHKAGGDLTLCFVTFSLNR